MHRLLSYHYLYLIPLLLSAVFSLKAFGLKWPKAYRTFSVFLIVTLFDEIFAIAWKWELHKAWGYLSWNNWVYNIFHLIRFPLFVLFYYKILDLTLVKKITLVVAPLIVIFGILDFFFIQTPHLMNSNTVLLTNVFGIFLSLAYFWQMLRSSKIVRLTSLAAFWISLGAFIYCSASIPHFIFSGSVDRQSELGILLLYIGVGLNVIQYTCYLIAFLCRPKSQ